MAISKPPIDPVWRLAPIDPQAPPFYLANVPGVIIVAAADADAARRIASSAALTSFDGEAWLDASLSSCEALAPTEDGIIARDFTAPAASAAAASTAAAATPPANVDIPTLGPLGATVGDTLTCTMGNWTGEPSGYGYEWRRDGEVLGTGPTNSYNVTAADVGHAITCVVTASNARGDTVAPPSNAVTVAAAAAASATAASDSRRR